MLKKYRSILVSFFLPLFALGILFLVLTLYLPSQAAGTIFTVNSTADTNDGTCNLADCTLREAILAANNSGDADTIVFSLPPSSTIVLNGERLPIITGKLTIDGSMAENLTVSGDNTSQIFVIDSVPPGYIGPIKTDDAMGIGTARGTTVTMTLPDGEEERDRG